MTSDSREPAGGRRRRRVAVVFGGRSAEHEISVVSASSVIQALDPSKYEAVPIGIDKGGKWHLVESVPALGGATNELPTVSSGGGAGVGLSRVPGDAALVAEDGSRSEIDVVFPVLHGPYGEDGTIQGMLELAGIPYVGAGVLASAVGMDKAVQKVLFAGAGLPVVRYEVVHEREWEADRDGVVARAWALEAPVFVKPATLGSSIGIRKVTRFEELTPALEEALSYARKALVERSMEGAREIECAVLGNDDPVASVPGEILAPGEFYDYSAKYLDPSTRLEIPARLSEDEMNDVPSMAVRAFQAIDCSGMARVDFFLREPEGVVVNEINTIPGFTAVSMYPKMWEASGLSYRELVDRLVELAIERYAVERKKGRVPAPTGERRNT